MAPFIVQIVVTLLARVKLGWRDAARAGLAVMFLFTAASHFSPLGRDMARMIPPPLTGAMWVIYLTGVLEAAGAIGLLLPRFRRTAAWCLLVLLVAMFPANVYAALHDVHLGEKSASPLWWRAPLQLFWMATLWWSTLARRKLSATGETQPA
ncbi:MAG TPA: MauE/DoxX family redox-associated membrane protein [Thermoanaerobaculia bacterium]|nr:MauE/DoxX family redox-associated membrane protein [Thermoanaerobaculia bacterium]